MKMILLFICSTSTQFSSIIVKKKQRNKTWIASLNNYMTAIFIGFPSIDPIIFCFVLWKIYKKYFDKIQNISMLKLQDLSIYYIIFIIIYNIFSDDDKCHHFLTSFSLLLFLLYFLLYDFLNFLNFFLKISSCALSQPLEIKKYTN